MKRAWDEGNIAETALDLATQNLDHNAQSLSGFCSLLHHVCVEHAVLLEVMGDCILCQERCLHADFSADPFTFVVGRLERMITTSAAAKLRTEVRTLDLIELLDSAPGFIAHGTGNVDL